ncbi:MAG: Smr/MutS family protein [Acidobacteria bacterium]|nr:Smr/MutS family protein [Acidobacteriota bacterium]
MPLPIGAAVVVRAFGNKRGVVIAVRRDGRYQVRIEGITLSCRDEDLTVPAEPRKEKPAGEKHPASTASEIAPPGCVDLHGLLVEEALARVVSEIDRSLLRGADRVKVVHGKGSGRIRDALHRCLASMPVVAAFRLDPRNPGVTWVLF